MSAACESPGRGAAARSAAQAARVWFFAAAVLTLPLFAHGCHRWDHDDEPAFVPPPPRVTELEPPR